MQVRMAELQLPAFFATHLIENGYAIRKVEELLGHIDDKTSMICTHVLNRGPMGVRGLADGFWMQLEGWRSA
jgi:hypothetical protein